MRHMLGLQTAGIQLLECVWTENERLLVNRVCCRYRFVSADRGLRVVNHECPPAGWLGRRCRCTECRQREHGDVVACLGRM